MRFRSSGLGKTELRGVLQGLRRSEKGLLVAEFQTTEPVQWRLWAGFEPSDIPKLVKVVFKPSLVLKTIQSVFWVKKNPKEPEDLMRIEWEKIHPRNKGDEKGKS